PKCVKFVGGELRASQQLLPFDSSNIDVLARRAHIANFYRTTLGEISLKVRSVYFDLLHFAGDSQTDDGPVVARAAAPLCLPAITHMRALAGHKQILRSTIEFVAAIENSSAMFNGHKIDTLIFLKDLSPVRDHFPKDAQPRDSTIGINLEAEMSATVRARY